MESEILAWPFAQWEASWNVYATALVMLDVASPGALKMYYQANRRLAGLFPQEFGGTIAALEEQVRAEEWDNLRQQIADGSIAPPAGFDSSAPWATIIPASRPFFTMGLLQDR